MTDDLRTWPIGLRRLAEIIGPAAAVRLAEIYGGTDSNHVPKKARRDHPWVQVIGLDKMELLCKAIGPSKIDIPRGTFRDLKKARIIGSDGSSREIALRIGCTERYVRMVRADAAPDEQQPNLFGDPD